MKRLLIVFLSICFLEVGYTQTPSCKEATAEEYFAYSLTKSVFVGKVVNVRTMPVIKNWAIRRIFTFEVSQVFKGEKFSTVKLYSLSGSNGYEDSVFQKGKQYLVFAYAQPAYNWLYITDRDPSFPKRNEEILSSSACMGTVDLSWSEGQKRLHDLFKSGVTVYPPPVH